MIPDSFEEAVKDICRCACIVESTVRRCDLGAEVRGEGAKLAIGHLITLQGYPSDAGSIEYPVPGPRLIEFGARPFEESDVIRRIVGDQDRPTAEL